MKRNWNDIKWIFEPDGSLIDIYVQEVSLDDWANVIHLINQKYMVKYGDRNQIDTKYIKDYLTDETGEMESKSASINLDRIQVNCHFFLGDQIEFDLDPKEINSIKDFELIEKFMLEVSNTVDNQITLTYENDPQFPLIKIDKNRGINKTLTQQEVKDYWGNPNSFRGKMKLFKTKMKIKFIPNRVKEQILESAIKTYESTKKEENVW